MIKKPPNKKDVFNRYNYCLVFYFKVNQAKIPLITKGWAFRVRKFKKKIYGTPPALSDLKSYAIPQKDIPIALWELFAIVTFSLLHEITT